MIRVSAKVLETSNPQIRVGGVGVMAANDRYRFQAAESSVPGSYKLIDFYDVEGESLSTFTMTSCEPLFAYGYIDGISVDRLLNGPTGTAVSAQRTSLDGKEVVRVESEVKMGDGGLATWILYFLPDTWQWAGATSPGLGESVVQHRVTYDEAEPLKVATYEDWTTDPDAPEGARRDITSIKIESVEFREVPESEFTLDAIGLETPVLPSAEGKPPSPLATGVAPSGTDATSSWMIISGVIILIVVGVACAVLAQRRKRARP